jgi:hypothetical protein
MGAQSLLFPVDGCFWTLTIHAKLGIQNPNRLDKRFGLLPSIEKYASLPWTHTSHY